MLRQLLTLLLFISPVTVAANPAIRCTELLPLTEKPANAREIERAEKRMAKAASTPYYSVEQIAEVIKKLERAGFSVNLSAMRYNHGGPEANAVIKSVLGTELSQSEILNHASRVHRNWNWWLIRAGLNVDKIKKNIPYLEADFIISTIKELHAQQVDVSEIGLQSHRHDEALKERIFQNTGRFISPAKLVDDATRKSLGGRPTIWPWWLEQAGLSKAEITWRGKPLSLIIEAALTAEVKASNKAQDKADLLSFHDVFRRETTLEIAGLDLGERNIIFIDALTPEDVLLDKELAEATGHIFEGLDVKQASTLNLMLEYFSDNSDLAAESIINFAKEKHNQDIPERDIYSIFEVIRENERVRELIESL